MRKLATIRAIQEIKAIENADLIQAYRVDGWWLVDKKDAHQVGDLAIYVEVDSWVPNELASFLSKGKEPKEFNGVKGERLRTIRLKGQLSQGLLLSGTQCPTGLMVKQSNSVIQHIFQEGDDVSEWLGIQKWEAPIPAQLAGQVRGNFPEAIPKTDQERVQNIRLEDYIQDFYEVTEKLHGSSCTFYLDMNKEFHVCSRNMDLKPDENNAYWKAAYKLNIEQRMREHNLIGYAIQGELCGTGINGNNYNLGLEFFTFDIYKQGEGYLKPQPRRELTKALGIPHVPVVVENVVLLNSKEKLLLSAEGKSAIAQCQREGLVYKSNNSDKTFKAVSNSWLLKNE